MLTPYPTEFPRECLEMMLSAARGKVPETATLIHCCWNVAGFALAKTLGGGPVVIAGSHLNLSDEEILQSALEHQPPEGMPIYAGIFPWSLVLALAIRYLAKLVENA